MKNRSAELSKKREDRKYLALCLQLTSGRGRKGNKGTMRAELSWSLWHHKGLCKNWTKSNNGLHWQAQLVLHSVGALI